MGSGYLVVLLCVCFDIFAAWYVVIFGLKLRLLAVVLGFLQFAEVAWPRSVVLYRNWTWFLYWLKYFGCLVFCLSYFSSSY